MKNNNKNKKKSKDINYEPLPYTFKNSFSSRYHGVRKDKRKDKVWWRAAVMLNRKNIYLGAYSIEEEAGYAFNVAHEIFTKGEIAIVNNISLGDMQAQEVEDKVINILLKAGWILAKKTDTMNERQKHLNEMNKIYVTSLLKSALYFDEQGLLTPELWEVYSRIITKRLNC